MEEGKKPGAQPGGSEYDGEDNDAANGVAPLLKRLDFMPSC
jgi:hypothetical protein